MLNVHLYHVKIKSVEISWVHNGWTKALNLKRAFKNQLEMHVHVYISKCFLSFTFFFFWSLRSALRLKKMRPKEKTQKEFKKESISGEIYRLHITLYLAGLSHQAGLEQISVSRTIVRPQHSLKAYMGFQSCRRKRTIDRRQNKDVPCSGGQRGTPL